ncbi:hypothetical protein [Kribbella sp. CA-247076]|uniref:hypothetical protein n=1 Tax=Kribbella sp. CA-247076 TaxID=3239941 RepID=UPI003D8ED6B3
MTNPLSSIVVQPRGPEILPGTPEYEWVASIIRAVERRAGLPGGWNGRLYEERNPGVGGAIHRDGAVSMQSAMLDVVREAYTEQGPLIDDDKLLVRLTAVTVVHEARHLLTDLGDERAPDAVKIMSPEEFVLEEGLNDTWTHRHVDAILQDIDMDTAVPEVMGVQAPASYPGFMKATDGLVDGVARISGQTPEQVRDTLHRTPRPQRFNALADLVIDSRLGDLMPDSHRAQLRHRLSGPVRRELANFAELGVAAGIPAETLAEWGEQQGGKAIAGLDAELGKVETHYRAWHEQNPGAESEPPRPQPSRQELILLRQLKAYAESEPPQPAVAEAAPDVAAAAAPREPSTAGRPGGPATAGRSGGPATAREVAHLQQFLGSHTASSRPAGSTVDSGDPTGQRPEPARRPRDGTARLSARYQPSRAFR